MGNPQVFQFGLQFFPASLRIKDYLKMFILFAWYFDGSMPVIHRSIHWVDRFFPGTDKQEAL